MMRAVLIGGCVLPAKAVIPCNVTFCPNLEIVTHKAAYHSHGQEVSIALSKQGSDLVGLSAV
jgi:hypothetical protein